MSLVQESLFPGLNLDQEPRKTYISLKRPSLPFKSKIKKSFDSIPHVGRHLAPDRLDQFIAEATQLLDEDIIEDRLHGRPEAKDQALQAAYFYLMQAHFFRSLDKKRNYDLKSHDQEKQRYYSSLLRQNK